MPAIQSEDYLFSYNFTVFCNRLLQYINTLYISVAIGIAADLSSPSYCLCWHTIKKATRK